MSITRARWSDQELENLVYMHKKGLDKEFMAKMLGRTEKAVIAMLYRLGYTAATTDEEAQEPEQLTLQPTQGTVVAKEELPVGEIQIQPIDTYILIKRGKPSWLQRLRCYFNGTQWKKVSDVIGSKL